jgi:hypothetical protein
MSHLPLLVGCTDEEIEAVEAFHNENEHMSGIVIIQEGNNSENPKVQG